MALLYCSQFQTWYCLVHKQALLIINVVGPPRTRSPVITKERNICINRSVGIIEVGIAWSWYQYMHLRRALEPTFIQMDNSWSDWLSFYLLRLFSIVAFVFYTVVINSDFIELISPTCIPWHMMSLQTVWHEIFAFSNFCDFSRDP